MSKIFSSYFFKSIFAYRVFHLLIYLSYDKYHFKKLSEKYQYQICFLTKINYFSYKIPVNGYAVMPLHFKTVAITDAEKQTCKTQ